MSGLWVRCLLRSLRIGLKARAEIALPEGLWLSIEAVNGSPRLWEMDGWWYLRWLQEKRILCAAKGKLGGADISVRLLSL